MNQARGGGGAAGTGVGAAARHIGVTLAGLLAIHLVVIALWTVGVPRTEVVSIGGGEGVLVPGEETAQPAQLLSLVVLLLGAAVASAMVIWRRYPTLRRPAGVLVTALNVGVLTALTASITPWIADALTGPDPLAPEGELLRVSPSAGPLFFGPLVPGIGGPEWQTLPAFAGWLVIGTTAALISLILFATVSVSDELDDERVGEVEAEQDPEQEHVRA